MARMQRAGGEDRLSALPDATLTRVLSHLPTDQSVRTSMLSRRWRRVFAAVPVVDIRNGTTAVSVGIDLSNGTTTVGAALKVSGALLSRDGAAPIRTFRVAGFIGRPSNALIDQWIATAVFAGAETLDLDLTQGGTGMPLCQHTNTRYERPKYDFYGLNFYTVPRRLLTHAALRHLRLGNCELRLPKHVETLTLGSLETLSLRRVDASEEALRRLVSACPRLAAMTLEECRWVRSIRVQPTALRLRAFTLRCCHEATDVFVNAPFLRSLDYKGSVPDPLSLTNWGAIEALAMDICETVSYCPKDSPKIWEVVAMVERCTSLKSLRLSAQPTPPFFPYRAWLPGLTRLELRGPFRNNLHITGLIGIVKNTPNLEVLTLTLVIDTSQPDQASSNKKIVVSKDMLSAQIKCFSSTLRRIHLVGYSGQEAQRRLVKFLLRKATCADEMCVSFAASVAQGSEAQTLLVKETMSWWRNPLIKINFTR
ncbi:hypothetical protein QYE76_038453 [Lolium multiflorum]|uniref:F-box domain-containing protein n=1 Tax=Lolium multiflorum TaxID=4521 RepID=A0AAD8T853_LOLMU|nr:hypothetical protein QYE76_038453 [Lolium multiflorum]